MAKVATNTLFSQAKRLKISINREINANEPRLTLGHLVDLTQSIDDAFSSGGKVYIPDVYSLRIVDGTGSEIKIKGTPLELEVDYKHLDSKRDFILGRLYPDDIASIVKRIQEFVDKRYGKTLEKDFKWIYNLDIILNDLKSAKDNKETIKKIVEHLKKAVKITLSEIKILLKDLSDDEEIETDDAQPTIDEIEARFRNASETAEYQKIWEDLGEELTKNLANHDRETNIVEANNKKFSATDTRRIINTFYEQIIAQFNKKEADIKPPWDKASQENRKKFNHLEKQYFLTNEVLKAKIVLEDNDKAKEFITNIEDLFENLGKDPKEEDKDDDSGEDEDTGGGEDDQTTAEHPNFIVQEEIIRNAIKALRLESTDIFVSLFLDEKTKQTLKDWLIIQLPDQIQTLLNNHEVTQEVENTIIDWIISNLTSEGESNDYFSINTAQYKELNKFLTKQFFDTYRQEFTDWIATAEPKEPEVVDVDTPKAEATVPGVDDQQTEAHQEKKKTINREKFIRDATTSFTNLYFDQDSEAFRDIVYGLIAKNLPSDLTTADLLHLKLKIYNKLKLDNSLFEFSQKYYETKLNSFGLGDSLKIANIYNTLDSILVLIDDPHKYITDLSEKEIIARFNLQGADIHIDELRTLLLGLIFVRRAHYYINHSTPIITWLKKDQADGASQRLGGLKEFVKEHGEDGVVALSLDSDGIEKMSIDEERKQKIKNLYRDLWISSVKGKTPDELIDIYLFYNVNPIDIDYMSLPVPDGFIYSDMAQAANLENPTALQADKSEIAQKMFSKIGKAGLLAIAPELAPILSALEKLPGGEIIQKKTGELGQVMATLGVVIGAGVATILGLLSKSIWATILGIGGGIAGLALGGIPGMIAGITGGTAAGAWLGGGGFKTISNLFGGSGGVAGTGLGTHLGTQAGTAFKIASPTMPTALVSVGAGVGGVAIVGTSIATIIGGGSQLHPASGLPDPGYQVPGEEIHCSQEKTPLEDRIFSSASGDVAIRGAEIVYDLYQGFWCFWNRSPGDYPEDITDYPDDYPDLFDEGRFSANPNESYESLSSCGDCLFWCTWLVLKAYTENNVPITISLNSQGQADAFRGENRFIEAATATPTNVPPGSAVYFKVKGGPDRLNHTALVIDVDQDGITFVQSNSSTKHGFITFNDSGVGVQNLFNETVIVGGFGTEFEVENP